MPSHPRAQRSRPERDEPALSSPTTSARPRALLLNWIRLHYALMLACAGGHIAHHGTSYMYRAIGRSGDRIASMRSRAHPEIRLQLTFLPELLRDTSRTDTQQTALYTLTHPPPPAEIPRGGCEMCDAPGCAVGWRVSWGRRATQHPALASFAAALPLPRPSVSHLSVDELADSRCMRAALGPIHDLGCPSRREWMPEEGDTEPCLMSVCLCVVVPETTSISSNSLSPGLSPRNAATCADERPRVQRL